MRVIDCGYNPKLFQEVVGRGGVAFCSPRPSQKESDSSSHLVPDSSSGMDQAVKMIFQEAKEQMSNFDMDCIEAFKRGDRVGLPFEGHSMFQPVDEQRLLMALRSNQGSDESSIVDCFLQFVGNYQYATRNQFMWDWFVYHQEHHGTGYGRTMRDHFSLIRHLVKYGGKMSLDDKLAKVFEISDDANSFGNGSLALCYPAYYYGTGIGGDPTEFVKQVTSFTHAHDEAMRAVTLLCNFIKSPQMLKEFQVPTEDELKQLYCREPQVTAYNTLLTAVFISDADSEMDVIRRGVWVGGDTDSTLATALLLWTLKRKASV